MLTADSPLTRAFEATADALTAGEFNRRSTPRIIIFKSYFFFDLAGDMNSPSLKGMVASHFFISSDRKEVYSRGDQTDQPRHSDRMPGHFFVLEANTTAHDNSAGVVFFVRFYGMFRKVFFRVFRGHFDAFFQGAAPKFGLSTGFGVSQHS